jgi:cystathionine beta-lyase/cystathionine gamma-synthase
MTDPVGRTQGSSTLAVHAGARAALQRLRLIAVAPGLGGVESLVSMPRNTSHTGLSAEAWRRAGIEDGFVRLSVGIEDVPDLRADLDRALSAAG